MIQLIFRFKHCMLSFIDVFSAILDGYPLNVIQVILKDWLLEVTGMVLINIPIIARNQLSSVIVFFTSSSFTRYRNGRITKQNTKASACPVTVPACACPKNFEVPSSIIEPTNSVSHTTKVTLMFTLVSLRLLILELSDSNWSRLLSELRSL